MAMTAQVKAELASTPVTKTCCRKSEVSSLLRFAGGLHIVSGRIVVEAELDTGAAARRVRKDVAEERRLIRQPTLPMAIQRDRIEEAGRSFFEHAAKGYEAIAAAEPQRVKKVDATGNVEEISARIWKLIEPLVKK